jgi:hypothetical protein
MPVFPDQKQIVLVDLPAAIDIGLFPEGLRARSRQEHKKENNRNDGNFRFHEDTLHSKDEIPAKAEQG